MGRHWMDRLARGMTVLLVCAMVWAMVGPVYAVGDDVGCADDDELPGDSGTLSCIVLVLGAASLAGGIWIRKLRHMLP